MTFTWSGPNRDNFDIYVQQIGAGAPLRRTQDPRHDSSPNWSPDGRTIAFLRRGPGGLPVEVWLMAPLEGVERRLVTIQPRRGFFQPSSVAWCPDSTCVLVSDSPGPDQPDAVFAIASETGKAAADTPAWPGERRRRRHLARGPPPDFPPRHYSVQRSVFSGWRWMPASSRMASPRGRRRRSMPERRRGPPTAARFCSGLAARSGDWMLGGGTPERLSFVGQDGLTPVVARTADGRQRLVYVRSLQTATSGGSRRLPPPRATIAARDGDRQYANRRQCQRVT